MFRCASRQFHYKQSAHTLFHARRRWCLRDTDENTTTCMYALLAYSALDDEVTVSSGPISNWGKFIKKIEVSLQLSSNYFTPSTVLDDSNTQ